MSNDRILDKDWVDRELLSFLRYDGEDRVLVQVAALAELMAPFSGSFSGLSALRKLLESRECFLRAKQVELGRLDQLASVDDVGSAVGVAADPDDGPGPHVSVWRVDRRDLVAPAPAPASTPVVSESARILALVLGDVSAPLGSAGVPQVDEDAEELAGRFIFPEHTRADDEAPAVERAKSRRRRRRRRPGRRRRAG